MPKAKNDVQDTSINDPHQNISVKITFYFSILKQSISDFFWELPTYSQSVRTPYCKKVVQICKTVSSWTKLLSKYKDHRAGKFCFAFGRLPPENTSARLRHHHHHHLRGKFFFLLLQWCLLLLQKEATRNSSASGCASKPKLKKI